MVTKVSLLDEIKSGGYEASLMTTFNAYLPFYEDVLLRKLASNGVRHNVLIMDQAQCQQSFANHPPRFAGRRYTLVPMQSSGAFHPKIILLVGKRKGLLAIGSHNITLSGFGVNRELTNLIRYQGKEDENSIAVIQQAWAHVLEWLESQGENIPTHLLSMVRTVTGFAPWLNTGATPPDDIGIIASSAQGPDLLTQLKTRINDEVSRVIVGGAFFDSRLDFLTQLQDALNPDELIVGIDPATVKAPPQLADLAGVRVVDTSLLTKEEDTDKQLNTYLHAKYMVVDTRSGGRHLVTGSANPSKPAWLSSTLTGNTEIMLVRSDAEVRAACADLGLSDIANAPEISAESWKAVKENWEKEEPDSPTGNPLGIAIAAEGRIQFKTPVTLSAPIHVQLMDADGINLEQLDVKASQQSFDLSPSPEALASVAMICISGGEGEEFQFYVHHVEQIQEHSRTGAQRKFSDALASLSFDSPDLSTFLNCVHRMIFSDDEGKPSSKPIALQASGPASSNQADSTPAGMSVDINDTKKIKKKRRFEAKEDLAYLLDVLIYHLKVDDVSMNAFESADKLGRTEEEQIDADDSEETVQQQQALSTEESQKILQLCHRKIRTLVSHTIDTLSQLKAQKLDIDSVLVKLIAVLAVLRELRNCDRTQSWIEKGKTTVPLDVRKQLLSSALATLFEGSQSLMQIDNSQPELANTEDLSRLKGLLIWLAWDCGLMFRPDSPYAEPPEAEDERFMANAALLAIAQIINSDEGVVAQAKESIGPLCSGDLSWLHWIEGFGAALKRPESLPTPSAEYTARPGDLAIHKSLPHLGFRLIRRAPYETDKIAMQGFSESKPLAVYKAEVISAFSTKELVRPSV
ncbi:hypothetical protein [Halioxenophilus sp. WMMB6]|uniref:hypothetical protein n=1 Tax=Halioxenophilus sp. WMMB6 TaxID=3073815 RepID=UPI00295EA9D6|nr:hypothetical protein [Halioxenophilus sp. WMMB6]